MAFALIAISVTTFLITIKNISVEYKQYNTVDYGYLNWKEDNKTEDKVIKNNTSVSIDSKYKDNPIEIYNNKIEGFQDVTGEYPQIRGLINKEIEKKINEDIYSRCANELVKIREEKITYDVMANFGNVISIFVHSNYYNDNIYIGLNYDLTTGKRLEFKDIFISDADINNILRKAVYERYILNSINASKEAVFVEEDFTKICQELFNYDFEFYFSNNTIYILNFDIHINMLENSNAIGIYNRFLIEENIYEKSNNNEEKYIYFNAYKGYGGIKKEEENLYIVYKYVEDGEDEDINKLIQKIISNELTEDKLYARKNRNKTIVMIYECFGYDYEDRLEINSNKEIIETIIIDKNYLEAFLAGAVRAEISDNSMLGKGKFNEYEIYKDEVNFKYKTSIYSYKVGALELINRNVYDVMLLGEI
jgi:hypothetical protein